MFIIKKLRADHVIDFAAEELKKYLRMMMPRCGEIAIAYAPDATDGFRLGLLEDFNLPCEAEDVVLDDAAKPVYPTLTIVKGPHLGDTFDLDSDVITLGRDPSNSVFLNDMTVSRHHARMALADIAQGRATIEDL